jgi:ABC-2 type transport system ATP-binding protein
MDEAAHCDRLGLMDLGRLIAVGSPVELKQESERRSGRLLAVEADDLRRAHRVLLRDRAGRQGVVLYGNSLHVRSLDPDADSLALAALLAGEGIGRIRVEPVPLSMDETFIDFIEASESAHA